MYWRKKNKKEKDDDDSATKIQLESTKKKVFAFFRIGKGVSISPDGEGGIANAGVAGTKKSDDEKGKKRGK